MLNVEFAIFLDKSVVTEYITFQKRVDAIIDSIHFVLLREAGATGKTIDILQQTKRWTPPKAAQASANLYKVPLSERFDRDSCHHRPSNPPQRAAIKPGLEILLRKGGKVGKMKASNVC